MMTFGTLWRKLTPFLIQIKLGSGMCRFDPFR